MRSGTGTGTGNVYFVCDYIIRPLHNTLVWQSRGREGRAATYGEQHPYQVPWRLGSAEHYVPEHAGQAERLHVAKT